MKDLRHLMVCTYQDQKTLRLPRQFPPTQKALRCVGHTVDYGSVIRSQLARAMDLQASCGANLVTLPADIRGKEMFAVYRVVRRWFSAKITSTLPYYRQ